ncbi:MAG: hypothetical protein ACJAVK_002775 [Akkermansiaceae bacterium]|jgi:hypothetical protein
MSKYLFCNLSVAPFLAITLVSSAGAVNLLVEDFTADDGGFVQEATGNSPIPSLYNSASGTWSMEGDDSGPTTNTITSPPIAVALSAGIQVSFDHRYSIEGDDYDGGGLQISINGGEFKNVPASAFTQNGYTNTGPLIGNHVLIGLDGFSTDSPGYGEGNFITSVASVGGVAAGSSIQVRFVGAFDEGARGPGIPNWEINSITVDTLPDTDGDGMPDDYEDAKSHDKTVDDSGDDPDLDASTNLLEYLQGTDPDDDDTDDDGLKDGVESNTGTWVSITDTGTDPLNPDSDGDTLSDGAEDAGGTFVSATQTGSDPNKADTDEDGAADGFEIAEGSNPNDSSSFPALPDLPEPLLYYPFDVEDATAVENLGSLETAGTLQGGATYGDSLDPTYGTAFVGNRDSDNDAYIQTGFIGTDLGFGPNSVYTAMAWVKWAGASGNLDHMVFGQEDGPGNNNQLHHGIRVDGSAPNVHYGGWGNDLNDAGTVAEETWTHLAWQFDGTDKVVFVDGVESARGPGATMAGHAFPVIIGGHGRDAPDPAGQSFNGAIDEVKIYGEALEETQIQAAMIPSGGGGPKGLEVLSIDYDRENENVTLTFTSRPGRSYSLLWTADFQDGPNYLEIDDGINADAVENITSYTFQAPRPDDNPGGEPAAKAFFIIKQNL